MSSAPLITYIRTHRKKTCLSQEDVAFLLGGMAGTSVRYHERGRRIPLLDTALAYELIYGPSVRDLYAGRFEAVEFRVLKRARSLRASFERRPKTPITRRKIAALDRLLKSVRSDDAV